MPIALLRLRMTKERLTRDMDVNWRFYGELPDQASRTSGATRVP
jgi:hypothetical protein